MTQKNYKSDFDCIIRLKDGKDPEGKKTVPWPGFDWDVVFWTSSKANTYTASCRAGVYTNCFPTGDGGMHFVFNNHRLGPGVLQWEPHFELPNDIYPDDIQDLFSRQPLGIELVTGAGFCPSGAEVEVMLPYIKGEPFTFEDFTPEQIEQLQRPATEAAGKLDQFVETASRAEAVREDNESVRVSAEKTRVSQEAARQTAESSRQKAETSRAASESERQQAETQRASAETTRATEFAGWKDEIDGKQDALTPTADLQITAGNIIGLTERAKMRVFVDMWNQAWGEYGGYDPENAPDAEHPFMGNEIWMTYEEAMEVMSYAALCKGCSNRVYMFAHANTRTLLPMALGENIYNISLQYAFLGCENLEAIRFLPRDGNLKITYLVNGLRNAFRYCKKLKTIYGEINVYNWTEGEGAWPPFGECVSLETVFIRRLRISLTLKWSPKISLQSMQFLVTNAENTTAITITVHADVYAKMTGDTTNAAAAALTEEEAAAWQQVLADAVAKNISFATA